MSDHFGTLYIKGLKGNTHVGTPFPFILFNDIASQTIKEILPFSV